jgi:hypothetical protein
MTERLLEGGTGRKMSYPTGSERFLLHFDFL